MSSKSRYHPGEKKTKRPRYAQWQPPRRISRFIRTFGAPTFSNENDLAVHLQELHGRGMEKVTLRAQYRLSKGRLKRLLRKK